MCVFYIKEFLSMQTEANGENGAHNMAIATVTCLLKLMADTDSLTSHTQSLILSQPKSQ